MRRPEAVQHATSSYVEILKYLKKRKKHLSEERTRTDPLRASSTPRMYVSWQSYGLNGNSTGVPLISSLGIANHECSSFCFVPKPGFPYGVSGVFYPRCRSSFKSLAFLQFTALQRGHQARAQRKDAARHLLPNMCSLPRSRRILSCELPYGCTDGEVPSREHQ